MVVVEVVTVFVAVNWESRDEKEKSKLFEKVDFSPCLHLSVICGGAVVSLSLLSLTWLSLR